MLTAKEQEVKRVRKHAINRDQTIKKRQNIYASRTENRGRPFHVYFNFLLVRSTLLKKYFKYLKF